MLDERPAINLGANRWAVELGLPMTYYRGKNLLDKTLTTFELLPSVLFFTDNNDPVGAKELAQNPLFQLEGHITQNLNRMTWISLDGFYQYGGETTTDGVAGHNTQSAFSLGGTIGVNLPHNFSIKAGYGKVITHSDDGPVGHMIRVNVGWTF